VEKNVAGIIIIGEKTEKYEQTPPLARDVSAKKKKNV